MTKTQEKERQEAIAKLQEHCPPGTTVYTILRHVSQSGMSRSIDVVLLGADGPWQITWLVGRVLDYRHDEKHDGLKVGGAGMDMGFHVVSTLSRVLYPSGFTCLGGNAGLRMTESCPSNDHSNGDRDYTPHHHREGDYALRHRWL